MTDTDINKTWSDVTGGINDESIDIKDDSDIDEMKDIVQTYDEINKEEKNHGSYRHGTITEMVKPTDPTQAIVQSSGNYIFHGVGILLIALFWEKGGELACYKQAEFTTDSAGKKSYGIKLLG